MKKTFAENTEGVTRFHLSFTGVNAGALYCGAEKQPGEQSFHGTYAPEAAFTDPRMCPECLALWNSAE